MGVATRGVGADVAGDGLDAACEGAGLVPGRSGLADGSRVVLIGAHWPSARR